MTAAPPRVVGVDLSLSSTGVAGINWAVSVPAPSLTRDATLQARWQRIRGIRAALVPYISGADLVVLEAPSYGSNDPGAHERAALWWLVVGYCDTHERPLATVAPSTLKVYATGSGRAKKEDVVQEAQRRRPDVDFRGNDAADALFLAMLGLDHLGHAPVQLPQTHRRALDSVQWPVMAA